MLNSQSLSANQKWKLWREQKEGKFKEIASNRSAMFNYFYNNNDVFKFISDQDFTIYSLNMFEMMDKQANIYFGCFLGVILIDKLILNRFLPRLRFKEWRLTANLIKFGFWPFALFKPIDYQFLQPYRDHMFEIQEKYNFGFQDYIQGNRIFERALTANRLEELLQKRELFDWTGIPELKE